jgi:hypothetical protein
MTRWRAAACLAAPVLLGVAATGVLVGSAPLRVTNIAWLAKGDAAQHYVGWVFFRNSPWQWPLGRSPDFGLEASSSVFYSDSIPLLALPFKAIGAALPVPFQYFGLWYLLCLVLQATLAWHLLGRVTPHTELRLLGAIFFLFAPPMLRRMGGVAGARHALVGHWLVLAGLALCLDARPARAGRAWTRPMLWMLLGVTAAWVHAYLLAMVLALWAADLTRRVGEAAVKVPATIGEAGMVLGGTLVALWQAGFFLIRGGFSARGFGSWGMNLWGLVAPREWSRVLPPLDEMSRANNYPGLGALALLLAAGVGALVARPWRTPAPRWWPLIAVCVACTLFALSNRVAFGPWKAVVPLPASWATAAGVLRVSGRMFWPAYYLLLWLALAWLVPRAAARGGRAAVGLGLLGLAALQVWDTSAGWLPIRSEHAVTGSAIPTPMQADFWAVAARNYRKVRSVPAGNGNRGWEAPALYAATNGLATDALYLARVDPRRLAVLNARVRQQLESGAFEADTLYILYGETYRWPLRSLDPAADLLGRVDGFVVLAPRWHRCATCRTTTEVAVVR